MSAIKFGTDGWRAVVGEDFTPENISKVAQAFADLYPSIEGTGKAVVIGYDRRNQSPEAAYLIASILLANGIEVMLSDGFCPTPTVSWYVKEKKLTAGIMVTASHNPPKWNGIKFKENYGGSASGEYCMAIEDRIDANERSGRKALIDKLDGHPKLKKFNPYGEYMESFARFVDVDRIRRSGFKIMFDPLFGSGCHYMTKLLGTTVSEIHTAADTNFGGLNPEPIPPNANELIERVRGGGFSCGLLTDGDADRAGAVDERGNFVTTHEVYSLLIRHVVENKGWKGEIIKSISTTRMVDRLANRFGLKLTTTPVGFKYISPAMKRPGVLVGGEESGGFGFPRHIPERDGVFSDLLLLEYMATAKKPLGQLVSDLQREFGPCRYRRIDNHLDLDTIRKVRAKMETLDIKSVGRRKVVRHETMDGHHFLFDDDSWLLFRASGTEPLIRIYAEAPSTEDVDELLEAGKKSVGL
jgi:phosphomannomutase